MARWKRRRGQGWGNLLKTEQRQFGIVALIQLTLLAIALRDWLKRPGSRMRGGSKWKWFPMLFVNFVGPITYLVWGRQG